MHRKPKKDQNNKEVRYWKWSDRSLVKYTNWDTDQPGHHTKSSEAEDCVVLFGPRKKWHDAPCGLSFKFICKLKSMDDSPDKLEA